MSNDFYSDTLMGDCSPDCIDDSGNSTEELQSFIDIEEELSCSETEDEDHYPFTKDEFVFSVGNNVQPTKPFPRRHEESKKRDPRSSREFTRKRFFSHSSHVVVPSQYQKTNTTPNFAAIKPPTPLSRSQTIGANYLFSAVPSPREEPPSPYKPPTVRSERSSSMRSRSMLNIKPPDLSGCSQVPLIAPILLDTSSSKENKVNFLPSSSQFPVKPTANRDEPSCFFSARRTSSDVVLPSPPMFDKRALQRRSTDSATTLYPPKLISKKKDSCEFISTSTVVDLLLGKFSNFFDSVIIVDCRYTYEFQGGHIPNAISIVPAEREERLQSEFLQNPFPGERVAIVFHCEFSSKRGPATYGRLRKLDRDAHGFHNHEKLYYPYLYVMEGGYEKFYQEYPRICEGVYVEMKDKRFKAELTHNKRLERQVCTRVKRANSVTISRKKNLSRSHQSLSFSTNAAE